MTKDEKKEFRRLEQEIVRLHDMGTTGECPPMIRGDDDARCSGSCDECFRRYIDFVRAGIFDRVRGRKSFGEAIKKARRAWRPW